MDADRDDVTLATLDKCFVIQCSHCKMVHEIVPFAEGIADTDALAARANSHADAHASACTREPMVQCPARCPNPSCRCQCMRESGHDNGHYSQILHQW